MGWGITVVSGAYNNQGGSDEPIIRFIHGHIWLLTCGKRGARKMAQLMEKLAESGVDVKGLVLRANFSIRFITPHGAPADGYFYR
jgi:hypothetical protein